MFTIDQWDEWKVAQQELEDAVAEEAVSQKRWERLDAHRELLTQAKDVISKGLKVILDNPDTDHEAAEDAIISLSNSVLLLDKEINVVWEECATESNKRHSLGRKVKDARRNEENKAIDARGWVDKQS